jgi:TolB-like protein
MTNVLLGPFCLDTRNDLLLRGTEPVALGKRAIILLRTLVERRGELVSKDALIEAAWPGQIVEENNLTVQIAALRRVLSAHAGGEDWIVTMPRRGYRFVGPVSAASGEGIHSAPLSVQVHSAHSAEQQPNRPPTDQRSPALPDKPSIAVLAFANMSDDPEQEFLADGIAEDIITALARWRGLFVIARNSSFTYKGRAVDVKQIGHELGVRYVLEGSLRKSGSRIRVTAQLVEARTGNHAWADRYDRDLADIFVVQDEISQAVTIAIAPAVAEAEQQRAMRRAPENLDAWAASFGARPSPPDGSAKVASARPRPPASG